MKHKALIISTALILVAGGILFILSHGGKKKIAPAYFIEDTNKFCLNEKCLEKTNGEWFIWENGKDKAADNDICDIFLNNLKKIKLGEIISTNKERFPELGINDNRYVLTMGAKKLLIGKVNDGYDGTFVMEENGDKIYLISQVIDKAIISKADYWLRKMVTNWPRLQLSKINIKHGDKETSISKNGEVWPETKFIDTISQLKSVKYLDAFDTTGSDVFQYWAEVDGSSPDKLSVGKKLDKRTVIYWASTDDKNFFEISKEDHALLTGVKF